MALLKAATADETSPPTAASLTCAISYPEVPKVTVPVGALLPVWPVTVVVTLTAAAGEVETEEVVAVVVEARRLLPTTVMVAEMLMAL